jgi:hypothetical protein
VNVLLNEALPATPDAYLQALDFQRPARLP